MGLEAIADRFTSLHPDTPVSISLEGHMTVLSLSGPMDLKLSTDVSVLLEAVIDGMDNDRVLVVDLRSVNYISSTGVGCLVNALISAGKRDLGFALRNMTEKVRAVFQVLGLISFFTVV